MDWAPITIVGQGLAGTALAWQLWRRGLAFRIVDRGDAVTASRLAAGLITPITGKRFALDAEFDRRLAIAADLYRFAEAATGASFFHRCGAVRMLRNEGEAERYRKKCGLEGHAQFQSEYQACDAPHGIIHMPHAARLDVLHYLNCSRAFFGEHCCYEVGTFPEEGVCIDCTGIAALRENRLPAEAFQPAKGEILTLKVPDWNEPRTHHFGYWLAPQGEQYRAGATYTWDELDEQPTREARDAILKDVERTLRRSVTVIDHQAAVRPISIDRQPIVRQLSDRRWAINGLGSKGTLDAPWLAAELIERIAGQMAEGLAR